MGANFVDSNVGPPNFTGSQVADNNDRDTDEVSKIDESIRITRIKLTP